MKATFIENMATLSSWISLNSTVELAISRLLIWSFSALFGHLSIFIMLSCIYEELFVLFRQCRKERTANVSDDDDVLCFLVDAYQIAV